jgi:hypothetical protein
MYQEAISVSQSCTPLPSKHAREGRRTAKADLQTSFATVPDRRGDEDEGNEEDLEDEDEVEEERVEMVDEEVKEWVRGEKSGRIKRVKRWAGADNGRRRRCWDRRGRAGPRGGRSELLQDLFSSG